MGASEKDSNRIAIVLATDSQDNVLMGLRQDSMKWVNPAGHIKVNEDPYEGCQRELMEETGLDVEDIQLVRVEYNKKKKLMLYLFKVVVDPKQEVDVSKDPDKEFSDVYFMDPNTIKDELQIPIEENIALKYWANN